MIAPVRPNAKPSADLFQKKALSGFAGMGGWCIAYERVIGRAVDYAINHCELAIASHAANHPHTQHSMEDIFAENYGALFAKRELGVVTLSPDCRHFSRAKGKTPNREGVSDQVRGLAWIAPQICGDCEPDLMFLENVREFLTWGPLRHAMDKSGIPMLDANGAPVMEPDPAHKGETYLKWRATLEALGYHVDFRILKACDYGAPTIRERIYFIMRRDGLPIVWPKPTHGDPKAKGFAKSGLKPWRTVAECIEASIPCPSIFITQEEAKELGFNVKRPLRAATLKRIARGTVRFVIEAAEPFIIGITHTKASGMVYPVSEPGRTVTTANGGEFALVEAFLSKLYGTCVDGVPLDRPAPTFTSGGNHEMLVAAWMAKHYGGVTGHELLRPLGAVTSVDHHSLIATFLAPYYKSGSGTTGRETAAPLPSITCTDRFQLVQAILEKEGDAIPAGFWRTWAFLIEQLGPDVPPPIVIRPNGIYLIVDLGMRMLIPRELARAQGFPEDYILDPVVAKIRNGKVVYRKLTKSEQVEKIGNSVCPDVAEALMRANCPGALPTPTPKKSRRVA